MDRAFTFIVNPTAGRGRTARVLPALTEALAVSSLDYELRLSAHPLEPEDIARDAFDRGRMVVAVGGDGLVGQLAGVAADHDGVLALLPTGSGNDFARFVGYDHRRPLEAIDTLRSGPEIRVDLGRVSGTWFCCVASTGFDAEANRWANGVKRLRGTTLYVAATLRTLASYRPRSFRLTIDDTVREVDAWLVAVGNGGSYGGGMRIAPGARVDDGLLDVTVVGPVSRSSFLRTFPRVFRGSHVEHPMVHTWTARSIRVEADHTDLHVYTDGEDRGPLPAEVVSAPRALRLLVPTGSPLTD